MSSLNPTPISSNDYASIVWTWRLANPFQCCTCGLEPPAFTSRSSVPCSGYHGLVSSILASICNQVEKTSLLALVGTASKVAVSIWLKVTDGGQIL